MSIYPASWVEADTGISLRTREAMRDYADGFAAAARGGERHGLEWVGAAASMLDHLARLATEGKEEGKDSPS